MTWKYALCKEKIDGKAIYTIREVYMNRDGSVWGYTEGGANPLDWVGDPDPDEEELLDDIKETLNHILIDCTCRPIIDLDTLVIEDFEDMPDDLKDIL